jgi:hypothetical protein
MQIPEIINKCVAFLGSKRANEDITVGGTVFFVSYSLPDIDRVMIYAVTARHNIDRIAELSVDNRVYVRVDTHASGPQFAWTEVSAWEYHEDDRVDVAAAQIGFLPEHDHRHIPISMFLDDEAIAKDRVGPGDDLFFPGLFVHHIGESKNIPIVRTGAIAAMPGERIQTKFGNVRGYLAEARSIGGLSGSPVFLFLGDFRLHQDSIGSPTKRMHLLGLIHGHYGVEDVLDAAGGVLQDDIPSRSINMGIAIVVPADDILAVLEQPKFRDARNRAREQFIAEQGGG